MLPCYAFLVLAALRKYVSAQPRVTFPIIAQLPAVAVADEIFSFTFSADTFSSELDINYTLGNAPPWLRLEGSNRTLTGRPSKNDVGEEHLQIIATDPVGTATSDFSLVILDEQSSLRARQDVFTERISQAGRYSAPSTLLLYPQSSFHLVFGPDVFRGGDGNVQHYASSGNNTPLPAWLSFDSAAVTFTGTTPPLLTPQSSPQLFAFTLAASQFAGFSQSVLHFQISVTNHILAFLQPTQKIIVAAGEEVTIPPLLGQLQLDGSPLDRLKITDTSSNQPEWLKLNLDDLSFTGTSPKDLRDTYFRLTVANDQNTFASIDIQLAVTGRQDNDNAEMFLGTVSAIIGQFFIYSFADTSIDSLVHDFDVDVGPAKSWLSFSRANLTLHGLVPSDSREGYFNVTLTTSEDGQVSMVEYLTVKVISNDPATIPANATNSGTQSSSGPISTTPPARDSVNQASDDRIRKLVLMIVLPLLASLAICLVVFMLWRRRRLQGTTRRTKSVPPMRENLRNSSSGSIVVLAEAERQSLSEASFEQLPSSVPPRVDLPWPLRERPHNKLLSVADEYDRDSPETRSSWDDMLMEVDCSVNSGHGAAPSRQLASTGATSRLLSSPEYSEPSRQGRSALITKTLLTKRGESFATSRRFNGRRSNGIGHETGPQGTTLRPVPPSPLLESPAMLISPYNAKPQSPMTPNYRVLHPNTSFGSQPRSTRNGSLASSDSRHAAPRSESSSDLLSRLERQTIAHRSSSSVYDNDDWTTEGSASAAQSGGQHSRHATGGYGLASNDILSGHEAARQWPLVPELPTAASQGVSLRSQVSEQSGGDSLRFI